VYHYSLGIVQSFIHSPSRLTLHFALHPCCVFSRLALTAIRPFEFLPPNFWFLRTGLRKPPPFTPWGWVLGVGGVTIHSHPSSLGGLPRSSSSRSACSWYYPRPVRFIFSHTAVIFFFPPSLSPPSLPFLSPSGVPPFVRTQQ